MFIAADNEAWRDQRHGQTRTLPSSPSSSFFCCCFLELITDTHKGPQRIEYKFQIAVHARRRRVHRAAKYSQRTHLKN
ncbi:Uncharacterized protein APZ42_018126 [Daphnia magna]|uniref:Uncharacterized protein n=1 Tax=Daphnia magna TaxID=35525 RepID=A0A164ZBP3_9CRUS|nr:Uncharacterized protein APZ42_018126 [Daphnia magna]